jgi:cyclohexadieny/prephenate dehydrogenase
MNIAIIGVGLLGSSLLRALARAKPDATLRVYDVNQNYLDEVRAFSPGSRVAISLDEIAESADVVFICAPVMEISKVICYLIPKLKDSSIVTDVGSVKRSIIEEVKSEFPDYSRYVPGHPISGGVQSGPTAGRADLFNGKTYFLTPYGKTDPHAVQSISELLTSIGAVVSIIDAVRHDAILSFVSHLPHVYAFAQMAAAQELSGKLGDDVLKYAGRSFSEVTQFAAANKHMWLDIFVTNADLILESNQIFLHQLSAFAKAIENRDVEKLSVLIETARLLRLRMEAEVPAP